MIDRTIAEGKASVRDIAKQHGLTGASVWRHTMNHLQPMAMEGANGIAGAVVKAVREQQAKERAQVQSVWDRRLNETYDKATIAYQVAMDKPEGAGVDAAAKFLMAQARLCDTGLRVDGVLAGGGETRVTVNVEQLVVLPNPQAQSKRLEPAEAIDVKLVE